MKDVNNFADLITLRGANLTSAVVVGLDPRPELLTASQQRQAGTDVRALARAYVEFAETVLDGVQEVAIAVKIQIAFYEVLGLPGIAAYARSVRLARERGLPVIGDIKRGDIGTSSEAYAEAHFGAPARAAGADVDAVTLSPYLGQDALEPFLARCRNEGRGAFALVRTSNPSARDFQDLQVDGAPLYRHVADHVARWGADLRGACGYSSLGAVVGATYPSELAEIRTAHPTLLLLVPGYGAQGGTAADVAAAFDGDGRGVLVASSRGILRAVRTGDENGELPTRAVRRAAEQMRDEIRTAFERRGQILGTRGTSS